MLGSFLTREHNHASTSVVSSFHISRSDGLELLFLAASIATLNDLVTLDDTQIMIKVMLIRTGAKGDTSCLIDDDEGNDSTLTSNVPTL